MTRGKGMENIFMHDIKSFQMCIVNCMECGCFVLYHCMCILGGE